jgi:hypothetical protein
MLARAAGFQQLATRAVEKLGEREVGQGGTSRCCTAGRACGSRRALIDTEVLAVDLDPVGVLLIHRFASDIVDLDESVESHAYLSLVMVGLNPNERV